MGVQSIRHPRRNFLECFLSRVPGKGEQRKEGGRRLVSSACLRACACEWVVSEKKGSGRAGGAGFDEMCQYVCVRARGWNPFDGVWW